MFDVNAASTRLSDFPSQNVDVYMSWKGVSTACVVGYQKGIGE